MNRQFMQLAHDEAVVDLFCGGGGWTALCGDAGIVPDVAVNHDATAIAYHTKNNPSCVHEQGDAWQVKPLALLAGLKERGFAGVGLMLASAACTTHSRARGSAPVSPRVHHLGWCIVKFARILSPRVLMIENVCEWREWGPLMVKRDEHGRPVRDPQGRIVKVHDPKRKGQHYRAFVRRMKALGYTVQERVLEASAFGAASRRKRLFLVLRRDGVAAVWPEEVAHGDVSNTGSHSKVGARNGALLRQGLLYPEDQGGENLQADATRNHEVGVPLGRRVHVARSLRVQNGQSGIDGGVQVLRRTGRACDVIDWSDLGRSIIDRPRALARKTLGRIAEGVRRFVLNDADPFVLRVTHGEGGGWKVSAIEAPLPTQTTRQDLAVCTPVVSVCAHGDGKDGKQLWGRGALPIEGPLNAIHSGGNNFALATPVLHVARNNCDAASVAGPIGTITSGGTHHGLITPVVMNNTTHHTGARVDSPLPTVTTGGQSGLTTPVMIEYYGNGRPHRVDDRLGTVVTKDRHGFVAPVIAPCGGPKRQPSPVNQPMHTLLAREDRGVGSAVIDAHPLTEAMIERGRKCAAMLVDLLGRENLTLDADGLVVVTLPDGVPRVIVDLLFRMLKPRELARAMGFSEDYILPPVQRHAVRLIGNAVSPIVGRALILANLPGGRSGRGDGERGAKGREECAA